MGMGNGKVRCPMAKEGKGRRVTNGTTRKHCRKKESGKVIIELALEPFRTERMGTTHTQAHGNPLGDGQI